MTIETDIANKLNEIKSLTAQLVLERDSAKAELARLNAAIDAAQGQTRRWRITLPTPGQAHETVQNPGYGSTATVAEWLHANGYEGAKPTDDGDWQIAAFYESAQSPTPVVLNIARYDSATLEWNEASPVTFNWTEA